jgi:hypothetical protein
VSDFFERYVDPLIEDAAFRLRHPHFHRREIELTLLDHVELGTLEGADATKQAKYEAAFAAGSRVPPLEVQILADSATLIFDGPDAVLAAARAFGATLHMARIAYDSTLTSQAFWNGSSGLASAAAATAQVLITEDDVTLLTEDGLELVA